MICLLIAASCTDKSQKVTVEGCGEEKTLIIDEAYTNKYGLEPLNFTLSYYSNVPHELPEDGKGYGTYAKFAQRDGDQVIEEVRLNSWSATGMNADNKDKMMKDILKNTTGILEFMYEVQDVKESKKTIAGKEYWVADAVVIEKSEAKSDNPTKYLVRNTLMAPSDTASRGLAVVQRAHPDSNVKSHDDFYRNACTAMVVSTIDFSIQ
ncbi:hypothetical protein BST97_05845 [Nonlabens spongiae]|uniref:Uncharacterized protein n=2 Tax=Nonlabens spongiae TaxID=331648 RepID=A0A1W6MJ06_9FLAO|nr:hypothetical protein BST97_05845 [Nonlabens spongiae]